MNLWRVSSFAVRTRYTQRTDIDKSHKMNSSNEQAPITQSLPLNDMVTLFNSTDNAELETRMSDCPLDNGKKQLISNTLSTVIKDRLEDLVPVEDDQQQRSLHQAILSAMFLYDPLLCDHYLNSLYHCGNIGLDSPTKLELIKKVKVVNDCFYNNTVEYSPDAETGFKKNSIFYFLFRQQLPDSYKFTNAFHRYVQLVLIGMTKEITTDKSLNINISTLATTINVDSHYPNRENYRRKLRAQQGYLGKGYGLSFHEGKTTSANEAAEKKLWYVIIFILCQNFAELQSSLLLSDFEKIDKQIERCCQLLSDTLNKPETLIINYLLAILPSHRVKDVLQYDDAFITTYTRLLEQRLELIRHTAQPLQDITQRDDASAASSSVSSTNPDVGFWRLSNKRNGSQNHESSKKQKTKNSVPINNQVENPLRSINVAANPSGAGRR